MNSKKIQTKGGVAKLQEQFFLRERFNAFTLDNGLKANFIADKLGISSGVLYQFRSGNAILTKTQVRQLKFFMDDYEKRNGENNEY